MRRQFGPVQKPTSRFWQIAARRIEKAPVSERVKFSSMQGADFAGAVGAACGTHAQRRACQVIAVRGWTRVQ